MRIILDANVLISYLLAPGKPRTITTIVETCLYGDIDLVVPEELLVELRASIAESPNLNQRISTVQVDRLVGIMMTVAEKPPKLMDTFPQYTTDPDDDYLVAYAVVHDVDYLVTGDKHLLVLKQVKDANIVLPATFLGILDK